MWGIFWHHKQGVSRRHWEKNDVAFFPLREEPGISCLDAQKGFSGGKGETLQPQTDRLNSVGSRAGGGCGTQGVWKLQHFHVS